MILRTWLASTFILAFGLWSTGALAEGHGVSPEYELQREWFAQWGKAWARKDCPAVHQHLSVGLAHGDPLAEELSGIMIITRICGGEDLNRAAQHFLRAAEHGRERSMLLLARLYAEGAGIESDALEARRWTQKAILGWVDGDPTEGEERLASMLGKDVPQQIREEFERLAPVLRSSATDKPSVADRIESGRGFFADPERACLWRLSAAREGGDEAQFALAMQLLEGRGIPRNDARGIEWLHRAAAGGNSQAQLILGRALARGAFGASKDAHAAYRWLVRAKTAGLPVEPAITEAASYLKPDTIDYLQRTAFEITPAAPRVRGDRQECR